MVMAATVDTPRAAPFLHRWAWAFVAGLLALYAALALTASLHKGVSYDEGEELAVGYDIWLHQDFRMEGANGDFVKRWATLPYLLTRPAFPPKDDVNWIKAEPYGLGYRFLFAVHNQPGQLLWQGRMMIVLLGVALGWLVFYCTREVFGPVGGLVALTLFAFSPDMLAYGAIVSTEMSICLALLGATWSIWRLLHRVTWGRLAASLGFVALLFLTKATALIIFPIVAILLAVRLWSKRPLPWQLGRARTIVTRRAQAGVVLGLVALHALFAWVILWAHYDFRYAANPNPADPAIQAWNRQEMNPISQQTRNFLAWSRSRHLFPEGYIDGMEYLLTDSELRGAFRNGHWIIGGDRAFFPYAIWAKTSPVILTLLAAGLGWWGVARMRNRRLAAQPQAAAAMVEFAPSFYHVTPYLTLVVVFLAVAIGQDLNIAHRHVLPVYPALFILTGGSIGLVWVRYKRWARAGVAALLLGYAAEAAAISPNFLAYFSPVVGGPGEGYKRLVESSLDWGMDLPNFKKWLDQHDPAGKQKVYFAYFGTDNPDYYKIDSTRMPSFPAWANQVVYTMRPGIYAISATIYESLYTSTRGPWNKKFEEAYQNCVKNLQIFNSTNNNPAARAELLKQHPLAEWMGEYDKYEKLRFGRLCAWLRHNHDPDDNVDHAILIWNLTQKELDDALFGKPAELADAPIWELRKG